MIASAVLYYRFSVLCLVSFCIRQSSKGDVGVQARDQKVRSKAKCQKFCFSELKMQYKGRGLTSREGLR